MLTSELSPTAHVTSITAKGHQRANAILRCFESRDHDLLVRAFTTYVRPLLEYNSIVWSPYLKSDIEAVETVQRKYTKRLAGLSFFRACFIQYSSILLISTRPTELTPCQGLILSYAGTAYSPNFCVHTTRKYNRKHEHNRNKWCGSYYLTFCNVPRAKTPI